MAQLARGLFLTVPLGPSWDSLAWGGVLLGGQSARLGPESSGYLYQLLRQAPNQLDVLVPVRGYVEVFLRCRNCISVPDHDLLLA
jgi:hypothetical protein